MSRDATTTLVPGFKGTRGQLLMCLKRHQPVTVGEIAEKFDVTPNGVRRHLKELEHDGLVTFTREVRGLGSPVFVYRLSPAGERLFPTSYDSALTEALGLVKERFGSAAVVDIFRQRWQRLVEGEQEALQKLPLAERTKRLAELLTSMGYMAEATEGAAATLREHNCTIRAIVEQFPEICAAEEQFIQEILGAQVTRQTHIAQGANCCEYCIAGSLSGAVAPPARTDMTSVEKA